MKRFFLLPTTLLLFACATAPIASQTAGLVEFAGSQKAIFDTGKAESIIPLAAMSGADDLFAVGAAAGLDGEITVYKGKPCVTRVRGNAYVVDHGVAHAATFAVWTHQSAWTEESIPSEIQSYLDLQNFVKLRAVAAGIDVGHPFPFQLLGSPSEVKWHVNVDLTEGKPITNALFVKSKASFVARNEPMDIIGFYSEHHAGIFISAFAPAIDPNSGVKNAIHIHMVTHDGKSAGHIDNLVIGSDMKLRLPKV